MLLIQDSSFLAQRQWLLRVPTPPHLWRSPISTATVFPTSPSASKLPAAQPGIPLSILAADFNLDGFPDLLLNGATMLFADKSRPGQFLAPLGLGTAPTSI